MIKGLIKFLAICLGTLLALGVALVVGVIFLLKQEHGFCAPDAIEQEIVSPDRRRVAQLWVCGEFLGATYSLEMEDVDHPNVWGKPGPIQTFTEMGTGRPRLRWVDARTLEISLPPRMQPGTELSHYHGIAIRYSHRD
ncbi:hypothetical protein [Phaeospirillum tilakii]|uniref:Uncharacterized protein n=1 Tax=Phaeospirillum tilakii TaxID=741673 RepID=A0ABW5C6V2_9PROT